MGGLDFRDREACESLAVVSALPPLLQLPTQINQRPVLADQARTHLFPSDECADTFPVVAPVDDLFRIQEVVSVLDDDLHVWRMLFGQHVDDVFVSLSSYRSVVSSGGYDESRGIHHMLLYPTRQHISLQLSRHISTPPD